MVRQPWLTVAFYISSWSFLGAALVFALIGLMTLGRNSPETSDASIHQRGQEAYNRAYKDAKSIGLPEEDAKRLAESMRDAEEASERINQEIKRSTEQGATAILGFGSFGMAASFFLAGIYLSLAGRINAFIDSRL